MRQPETPPKVRKAAPVQARGQRVCGAVAFEIDVPAVWAWHEHSAASRHAQGAAYTTYVGSWKSRFRLLEGAEALSRYEDPHRGRRAASAAAAARRFCTSAARAEDGQHPARPVLGADRSRAALPHVHARTRRLDLGGRAVGPAQRLSRRALGAAETQETPPARAHVLTVAQGLRAGRSLKTGPRAPRAIGPGDAARRSGTRRNDRSSGLEGHRPEARMADGVFCCCLMLDA